MHRDLMSFVDAKANLLQEVATRKDVGAVYNHLPELSDKCAQPKENLLYVNEVLLEDIVYKLSNWTNNFHLCLIRPLSLLLQ
jgi:hypothetical protein